MQLTASEQQRTIPSLTVLLKDFIIISRTLLKRTTKLNDLRFFSINLLGLCTALKNDINATCAELVYGTNFILPSDLITSEAVCQPLILSYGSKLVETMRTLNPSATAMHGNPKLMSIPY